MTTKTEVTPKELADAMEACRTAKENWVSAKSSTQIACNQETNAHNDYNRAKKAFEDLIAQAVGEHEK